MLLLLTLACRRHQFNEHAALEKGYSKASVAAVQAGLQSAAQKAQAELAAMGKWGTRPAATTPSVS